MKKHLPSLSLRNILAGSIAALVSMAPSPAATLTWDTVSGDGAASTGAGGIAQNGPGTTTIGAIGGVTTMSYTGSTAVNRGTLSVLGKAAGTTSQTFASTALAPGASAVALNRGAGTSTTVTLGALTNPAGTYLKDNIPTGKEWWEVLRTSIANHDLFQLF